MTEMLVVRSKVKGCAKGMNVAGNFAEGLHKVASDLIKDACTRAKENKRATIMAKDLAYSFLVNKKTPEMLVVKSKVKEFAKGCNVSSEFADALNTVLNFHVQEACRRAKENKRSTIQTRDL